GPALADEDATAAGPLPEFGVLKVKNKILLVLLAKQILRVTRHTNNRHGSASQTAQPAVGFVVRRCNRGSAQALLVDTEFQHVSCDQFPIIGWNRVRSRLREEPHR